jgi:phenylacetate-coenzyme A ligase PaaK-like adenylate-forming protein
MWEHSPYLAIASRLRREETLSRDERLDRAFHRLREIVGYADRHVPFYRDRFRAAGFSPDALRSPGDLTRIPLLTKEDVRNHGDRLTSEEYARPLLIDKRTSGSTGVSLHVLTDPECMQIRRGITLYRDRWTGWNLGEPRAMVWGNPPPRPGLRGHLRRALLEREFYLDTLRMNEEALRAFAHEVLARRPTLFFGHAHSLYLFARFWREQGLPPYRPRGVISTAMVLHSHERREIEGVFGTRVFDRYGCEEVSLIASECEAHQGLHLNTDGIWTEVMDDPEHPGLPGKLIVTDLLNRGMPLVRYEVGDRGKLKTGACACGRSYPLLEEVAGRVADYLMTPDGDWVSGISLTENFATLIPGVEQVQVVQDRRDHLLLNLVPAPTFNEESKARIAALVVERFGEAMTYEISLLEKISPEPSGKYRFAINLLTASSGSTPPVPVGGTTPDQA